MAKKIGKIWLLKLAVYEAPSAACSGGKTAQHACRWLLQPPQLPNPSPRICFNRYHLHPVSCTERKWTIQGVLTDAYTHGSSSPVKMQNLSMTPTLPVLLLSQPAQPLEGSTVPVLPPLRSFAWTLDKWKHSTWSPLCLLVLLLLQLASATGPLTKDQEDSLLLPVCPPLSREP